VIEIEALAKDLFGSIPRIIATELRLSRRTSKAKEEAKLHRDIKEKRKSEEQGILEVPTPRGLSKAIASVKAMKAATAS
jgi:hypothetical protein